MNFSNQALAALQWWAQTEAALEQGQAELAKLRENTTQCRQLRHQIEAPPPTLPDVETLMARISFLEGQLAKYEETDAHPPGQISPLGETIPLGRSPTPAPQPLA